MARSSRSREAARRGTARNGADTDEKRTLHAATLSPYLAARELVTEERRGLERQRNAAAAFASLLAVGLLVAIGAVVFLATTTRVEVKTYAIDRATGRTIRPISGDEYASLKETQMKAVIEDILVGFRTIYADPSATYHGLQEAWDHVLDGSKAHTWLTDYYERPANRPSRLVGKIQRTITDVEITRIGDSQSWTLLWTERRIKSNGVVMDDTYEGELTIMHVEPTTSEAVRKNLTGTYITGISWRYTSSKQSEAT